MTGVQEHHHKELGEAVRRRREELGMSHQRFSQLSQEWDEKVIKSHRKKKGIGTTAISKIEQGEPAKRQPHTLVVLDHVLRWPEGTAAAIWRGEERPDGPVTPDLPSEEGQEVNRAASAVEVATARKEVNDLRLEVAQIAERVDDFERLLLDLLNKPLHEFLNPEERE